MAFSLCSAASFGLFLMLSAALTAPIAMAIPLVETGATSSIELSGGVTYTARVDAGKNVSFSKLLYSLSGQQPIEGKVDVWGASDYTGLRGSTGKVAISSSATSKDISTLPFGRYLSIEITSSSTWTMRMLDLETNSNPLVKEVKMTDSLGVEKVAYGKESITFTALALSPDGLANINTVKLTITNPEGVARLTNQIMAESGGAEFGSYYRHTYTVSQTAKAGEWTAKVVVEDDFGKTNEKTVKFHVRIPTASISIEPAVAYDNDSIKCSVTPYSEENNGNIYTSVSWYKTDVNQSSLWTSATVPNGTRKEFSVAHNFTEAGDLWKCIVAVDDGKEKSGLINSTERLIRVVGSEHCVDTDGGNVKETRGLTSGKLSTGSLTDMQDSCDGKVLTEYYCLSDVVTKTTHTCQHYCVDGACTSNHDADGDGYTILSGDCDDTDEDISPASPEICLNGKDDDCDGSIDEANCGCRNGDMKPCGDYLGECIQGRIICKDNMWSSECVGGVKPVTEVCNNDLDDDCDGITDEDECRCRNGDIKKCGSEVGMCESGLQTCSNGAWGACTGNIPPSSEICNGLDDDCDGTVDNECVSQDEADKLCSNGAKDSGEDGVDCGGICPKKCEGGIPELQLDSDMATWLAVSALGILIMGATGVYIMFATKKGGGAVQ